MLWCVQYLRALFYWDMAGDAAMVLNEIEHAIRCFTRIIELSAPQNAADRNASNPPSVTRLGLKEIKEESVGTHPHHQSAANGHGMPTFAVARSKTVTGAALTPGSASNSYSVPDDPKAPAPPAIGGFTSGPGTSHAAGTDSAGAHTPVALPAPATVMTFTEPKYICDVLSLITWERRLAEAYTSTRTYERAMLHLRNAMHHCGLRLPQVMKDMSVEEVTSLAKQVKFQFPPTTKPVMLDKVTHLPCPLPFDLVVLLKLLVLCCGGGAVSVGSGQSHALLGADRFR